MGLFKKFAVSHKYKVFQIIFLIIFSSLIGIPLPYISKLLIDNVLLRGQYDDIRTIFFWFLIIVGVQIVVGRVSAIKNAKFILAFNKKLRKNLFNNNLEHLNTSKDVSTIQTIIVNDIELLCSNVLQIVIVFFSNITTLLGYLTMIFLINYKLSFVSLFFVPIYIYWIMYVSKKLKILNMDLQISKGNILSEVDNTFLNILVVRIYNLVNFAKQRFFTAVEENVNISKDIIIYNNFVSIISGVIVTGASFIPLFVGIIYVKNGSLTVGELIAFNSYCSLLFNPVTSLLELFTKAKTAEVYERRYNEHNSFYKEKDRKLNQQKLEIKTPNDLLDSYNLTLFKGSKQVLAQDINVSLNVGDVARLIGGNGTGKSLLLKSLVQINKNYSGSIYFEGKLVNNIYPEKASEKIIYVSNDQNLFFETLEKNLKGSNNVSQNKMLSILDVVNLTEKIEELPEGLSTRREKIEEQFSNGEMQKLRLARALITLPQMLILDEVFSNIDPEQTKSIFRKIRDNYPAMSIIFVEHHLTSEIRYNVEWKLENKQLFIRSV